jgi:hypothetical protein
MPKRRAITHDGLLWCTKDGEIHHISEFYVSDPDPWFTDDQGRVWGKPMSWCKECSRAHQAERTRLKAEARAVDGKLEAGASAYRNSRPRTQEELDREWVTDEMLAQAVKRLPKDD